jgi:hypothetical protein
MRPHAKYLHNTLVFDDVINQAVLNVDAAGISAPQIAEEFFKRRWLSKRVLREDTQQLLRLRAETRRFQTPGIFLGLFRENNSPRCHQPGSVSHWSAGVASPLMMDSRMPGTESRCMVSCMAFQSSSPTRTALERRPVMRIGL